MNFMYLMLASCCDDEAYLLLVMDANALILQKHRMRVRESTSPSTIEEHYTSQAYDHESKVEAARNTWQILIHT
eukprot:scaffold1227_cov175-Skeletonema_marinoi.AAC.2